MFKWLKCMFKKEKINKQQIKKVYVVGDIIFISYTVDNVYHRTDGPAVYQYYLDSDDNMVLVNKSYYVNGKYHSEHGPAYIDWYRHSQGKCLCTVVYYIEGKKTRLDGPAWYNYNYNGELIGTRYYINDVQYDEFEFLVASQLYEIKNGKLVKKGE